jgi:antirestriction protein ArdC
LESTLYQSVFRQITCHIEKGVRLYRYAPCRRLVHPAVLDEAAALIEGTGARLRYRGAPHYCIRSDTVTLPRIERQKDEALALKTSFHELIHWSGAKGRLDRTWEELSGAQEYAMEELVAEFGAAFLCAEFGVTPGILPYAASYIESFSQALHAKGAPVPGLMDAAGLAEEAVLYLRAAQRR